MKIRSLLLTALALLSTSAAFANAPEQKSREPQPAAREQPLLENLANGMRELLRAAVPEISLPTIELKLPALDPSRR